jgi:ElaB/YqjD/DUF883 family membrane-anchored ribosome-binding protein
MNTKTKTSPDPSDVADQMAQLRADISILTSTVTEMAKVKGVEVSQATKDQLEAAKATAATHAQAAKDQAGLLQDQANDFVRTQPATAVGMAAAVGFVIGMLMSRK